MPPVFMLMFLFGDIHLSKESLCLPQLHLAVLVAIPHCCVLPQMPSQDGWRLPGTPASLLLLCASSQFPLIWGSWGQVMSDHLLAARGGSGAHLWGSWVILSPCSSASFLMSLQGQLRGSGRGCWDAAIGRKEAQNQTFAFYLNRLQPQELSASFPHLPE